MLILLSALLSTLGSMFRSRAVLELENIALRHQIGVLKRSARKRCDGVDAGCQVQARGPATRVVFGPGFDGRRPLILRGA